MCGLGIVKETILNRFFYEYVGSSLPLLTVALAAALTVALTVDLVALGGLTVALAVLLASATRHHGGAR